MQNQIEDGIRIDLDEDGFLVNPHDWNEAIARYLAAQDGILSLTEKHWLIINYLRNHYMESGAAPLIRKLCTDNQFSLKQVFDLFPKGPANGACRIAGLAKPDGCV